MTKKSAARILRDAQAAAAKQHAKQNTIWDDLNQTYAMAAQALGQHAGIAMMLNRKEVFPFLRDYKSVVANITALTNDLRAMSAELLEINKQHAGKTGGSPDPDEVMQSIRIFEQYNLFLERHQAVIMPVAMHIVEEFGAAEVAFNQAIANSALVKAQDPNSNEPIDIEFKDVKPAVEAAHP